MSSTSREDKEILPKLFARISHDSKRNFRQIRSIFDLLCMDAQFTDDQMELIKMISGIAEKGEHEFQGLDHFANQIDVGDAVGAIGFSDVLTSVAGGCEEVTVTAVNDLDFEVEINPHALKSILLEVLSNAQKFCPEGETPELKISTSVDSSTGGRTVRFNSPSIGVCSNGIHNLWLPFARDGKATDIEGYGVGLTVIKYLVSQSGGDISLHHSDEEGFSLDWHLAEPDQLQVGQAA